MNIGIRSSRVDSSLAIRVASIALAIAALAAGRVVAGGSASGRAKEVEDVRRALDASPDGRAFVLVALRRSVYAAGADGARLLSVRERQREVLDDLGDDEFGAVYRYEHIPALSGWVGRAGLEKLSVHPIVDSVGLDGRGRLSLDESRAYIRADDVREILGLTGDGAIVAVLDTGV
ncbi:MAG: hypothetical protein JXP34_04160, partial [Planctomycetes bacterium]|nr:hypothetical protein [Planctomycetota bacterium]